MDRLASSRLEKGHATLHKYNAPAKGEERLFVVVYTTYYDKYWGLNYSKKKLQKLST